MVFICTYFCKYVKISSIELGFQDEFKLIKEPGIYTPNLITLSFIIFGICTNKCVVIGFPLKYSSKNLESIFYYNFEYICGLLDKRCSPNFCSSLSATLFLAVNFRRCVPVPSSPPLLPLHILCPNALSHLFPKLATCNLHRKFIDNKVVSCWDAAMISRRAEVAQ